MEAIDTVMNKEQVREALKYKEDVTREICPQCIEHLTKAQAEISFPKGEKQGYEKGYNKALAQLADMTEECKQIGRKEVVEWIDGNGIWAQVPFKVKESEETMWCLFPNEWQSFKKKLGL